MAAAIRYCEGCGYSEDSVRRRANDWEKLMRYALERGVTELTEELEAEYEQIIEELPEARSTRRDKLTRIRQLFQFSRIGRFERMGPLVAYRVPEEHADTLARYRASLEARGLSNSCITARTNAAGRLLHSLGGDRPVESLSPEDIASHLEGLAKTYAATSMKVIRDRLADFVSFLAAAGAAQGGTARFFDGRNPRAFTSPQPVYSAEELSKIVAEAKTGSKNPRRDHLLVLLAVQYGMRSSDIISLRFDNIDTANRTIRFVQQKTGALVAYPLTLEVILAISDYGKNERPESDDPHIFLSPKPPFAPENDGRGKVYHAVSRSIANAGIEQGDRKRGAHALRHSLATQLMSNGVGYPAIAEMLGHSGIKGRDATRQYLAMDIDRLRTVALEVE